MKNYNRTKLACYLGFVTQAITANFTPLLFLSFHREYQVPLVQLALIPAVFYFMQLLVDFLCARLAKYIDYRKYIIVSEVTSALGLIGLTFVPNLFAQPFIGILLCVMIYSIGSGLIEVLCSPIIEACPFPNKESMMSLLHSFYCWGAVGVIVGSTLFFALFGVENWRYLSLFWALIPLYNIYNFSTCPIEPIVPDAEEMTMGQLLKNKVFWVFLLLMIATGACESSMAQWASAFTEASFNIGKTLGDLAGPCGFALCMGFSRLWYGKMGMKVNLSNFMLLSGVLCLIGYVTASLASIPIVALTGCMLCGLAVGIMWPGSISLSSARITTGGTAMFALLALAGDIGGVVGPSVVGICTHYSGENIQSGLLYAGIFSLLLMSCLLYLRLKKTPAA